MAVHMFEDSAHPKGPFSHSHDMAQIKKCRRTPGVEWGWVLLIYESGIQLKSFE